MSKSCPLVFRKIDATVSKISTATVVTGISLYLLTTNLLILLFIAVDFMIRLSPYKPYSPIFLFSQTVQKFFHIPAHMIDAGGKRLAAFFGLGFTLSILISEYMHWHGAGVFLALLFIVCALPDVLFGFCIACKIYSFVKKVYPKGFI